MSGILDPHLFRVAKILDGKTKYFVPKYQRSFSWSEDETKELWEDIIQSIDRGRKEYFMGTMVLRGEESAWEIIDGQQRIACLAMIFSAVRNVFKAHNDARSERVYTSFLGGMDFSRDAKPSPLLELNETNQPYYRNYIDAAADLLQVSEALKDRHLQKSNRYLLEAYTFFLEKVSTEAARSGSQYDEWLQRLLAFVGESVKLIVIPVKSEEDAFLIFESLNARGKELAVSDLVKNRLYYEAGPNEVTRAQELWEHMETDLMNRAVPDYLRHYWIAKKSVSSARAVREKDLYRSIRDDVRGSREAIALLDDVASSARHYSMISDYSLWPNDDRHYGKAFQDHLDELRLFGVSQCYPVLLNAIEVFRAPDKIAETFRIIAAFSFRYNIIGNGTSGNLESIFGEIAYNIRTTAFMTPREVADHLRSVSSDLRFRTDFELAVISRGNARLARHILAKLNNHMGGGETIANPDARKVNLEHILPQSLGVAWSQDFTTGTEPKDYVYRIGNLTLLTAKANSSIANRSIQDKLSAAFIQSKLPINDFVKKATKWGDEEITKRQQELAKAALQVWRL